MYPLSRNTELFQTEFHFEFWGDWDKVLIYFNCMCLSSGIVKADLNFKRVQISPQYYYCCVSVVTKLNKLGVLMRFFLGFRGFGVFFYILKYFQT